MIINSKPQKSTATRMQMDHGDTKVIFLKNHAAAAGVGKSRQNKGKAWKRWGKAVIGSNMMAAPYHRRPFHKKKSTRKHCQPIVAVADTNLPVKHGKVCNILQTSRLLKNKKETMKYPNLQKFVRCKNGNGTQAVTFHAVPPRHWKNRICTFHPWHLFWEIPAHFCTSKVAWENSWLESYCQKTTSAQPWALNEFQGNVSAPLLRLSCLLQISNRSFVS